MKYTLNIKKLVDVNRFVAHSKRMVCALTSKLACKIIGIDYCSISVGVFDGEFKTQKKAG